MREGSDKASLIARRLEPDAHEANGAAFFSGKADTGKSKHVKRRKERSVVREMQSSILNRHTHLEGPVIDTVLEQFKQVEIVPWELSL